MENSFLKNSLRIIRYLGVLRAIQIAARDWGNDEKPSPSPSPTNTSVKELKEDKTIIRSKL